MNASQFSTMSDNQLIMQENLAEWLSEGVKANIGDNIKLIPRYAVIVLQNDSRKPEESANDFTIRMRLKKLIVKNQLYHARLKSLFEYDQRRQVDDELTDAVKLESLTEEKENNA